MTKEFVVYWANGNEKVIGKNLVDAVSKIKTPINEIETGFLVRVKEITRKPFYRVSKFKYWDCRCFWNALGNSKD